jgi:hypothetical protein
MGNRYGNYQQEPEESTVGTAAYPQKIYNSWDSNWRCFVGTTLIIGLEEQTWPWVKKELSKAFKGGYPTQLNIEWRIPRKSSGWMDTPLGKSCDAAAWLDRGLD